MASRLQRPTIHMPSLDGANGWLNSGPLSPADLRGHVVAVDFWTYTCVNWLRTAPYLRAWAEKYEDQGLIVIGVHTPEFPFEHDLENVERMLKKLRVVYPVAIDNDYAVWDAFSNRYWPALYLADADGALRYRHFGEGQYVESERAIQELLGVDEDIVSVEPTGPEVPAEWDELESPETYLGYPQAERFASSGGEVPGERRSYAAPESLKKNYWALTGEWTIRSQAAVLHEAGGRLSYRFHARDVNLVMAPGEAPVPFRVLVDGQPPRASHGEDADEQGNGVLFEPRLYQLIREPGPISDRTFEITFAEPGAQVNVFTFG